MKSIENLANEIANQAVHTSDAFDYAVAVSLIKAHDARQNAIVRESLLDILTSARISDDSKERVQKLYNELDAKAVNSDDEVECPCCDGKGYRECKAFDKVLETQDPCPVCDGKGSIPVDDDMRNASVSDWFK